MNQKRSTSTYCLLIIILALTCSGLSASPLMLGLKLSGNISKLSGDYDLHNRSGNNSRNRFYPGYGTTLFLEIPLKKFSLQTEVCYRQKSLYYSQDPDIVGGSWKGRARFNYLEIPLLFKHNFNNSRKQFFVAGPTVNFLLDAEELDYSRGNTSNGHNHYDYITCLDDYFKPVTLGFTVGVGSMMLDLSHFEIAAELRVNYDITSATEKVDFVDSNTEEEWYFDGSRFFDIALNFSFAFKFGEKK